MVEKVKETKGESFFNIGGSVVNHIMWDLENQELITMCEYLEKFYGLMIYRKDFEGRLDDLFEGCFNEIRNAIGVYLKILEKPMKKQFEIDLERKEMLVIGQCNRTIKGQLTHACISGQNASWARAVVSHLAELTIFFFKKKRITDV